MRVLFVSLRGPTNANRRGGAQDYIRRLSAPWARAGHEIRILCGQEVVDGEFLPSREIVDGIAVTRCGTPTGRFFPVARAARDMAGGADIVIENLLGYPLFLPWILDRETVLLAIKHHFEGTTFIRTQGVMKGLAGMALERIAEPVAYRRTRWVTNSEKTRSGLLAQLPRPRFDPVVVPPGIDFDAGGPRARRSEQPQVLYFGALDLRRKRVDELIEAFRTVIDRLPSARMVIAGRGPHEEQLRSLASGLPVEFPGFISEERKIELLDQSWVFCSPSESEGFGITWVEANARGLPVVGYELGLDTVTPECSVMVPLGSVEQLGDALAGLLLDTGKRRTMEAAARRNARRFSWHRSSDRLFDYLERELAGAPGFAERPGSISSR